MASLQLIDVNFQQSANAAAHRTKEYITNGLILRRGQVCSMTLNFNKPPQTGDSFTITAETGSRPSEARNTRIVMAVSSSGSRTAWSVTRGAISGSSLGLTMNSPVTAVIGRYKLILQINSAGRTSTFNMGTFVLLFNCWVPGDEVYMASEAERVEYVLNDVGLYWFGSASSFDSRMWNLGQFENGIMDICLTMLERTSIYASDEAVDVSRRNDPLHVGRVMSAMVNSNDNDNGVIVGNWSGNYSGGVSPTRWNGSVDILRQWIKSGPVKYGQCWVFAGLLCTALRCLGIPARMMVNFSSAHDTNGNLIIDNYYDANGKKDNSRTRDSVWNFHAWDEFWSVRKDIGSLYNGWQIVDSTPQEPSGGIYRLGPCSQKAVKEGDVDLPYDGPFVFTEVNADTNHWVINNDGSTRLVYSEPDVVGRFTSTKAVGSFSRVDVTNDYKYPEGSAKEREVFNKAKQKMQPAVSGFRMAAREAAVQAPPVKPQFSGVFKFSETQVGQDLTMTLILKSTAATTMTIEINSTASAIIYNSTPVGVIRTEKQSVTLRPHEEKSILIIITYSQYKSKITPDNMIQCVAVCEDEKGGRLLVDKVAKLTNPPMLLRVNEPARFDKTTTVDCIFSNPINETVNDSVLVIEGSGLMQDQLVVKVPLLKPKQRVTVECQMHPYRVGEKWILADFSSNKFSNVKAFQAFDVASC